MRHFLVCALLCAGAAVPAAAQDAAAATPPFTVSGSVGLVTDYRFRGVSQSDKDMAVQGALTVAHASGAYAGFWASNLAGWGQFGGANMELDLIAGYKLPVGGGAVDVGLTWYMYPGGSSNTDFAEPYFKLSGTVGPVSLLAGVAYAPKQQALGQWYFTGASNQTGIPDRFNAKDDNLYIWGDGAFGIPNTPLTAKAHIGYSDGNPGLGPNGTSVAPTGKYWDYSVGLDFVIKPVTLSVSYVDTDITRNGSAYLLPNFSDRSGNSIADGKFLFSVTASF